MARRARKQRITLRFKRREQLKHHLRAVLARSVALALIAGFGAGLFMGHDTFFTRFLHQHVPQVQINSPQTLAGLPILSELPNTRLWLWVPGSGLWLEKRVCRRYAAVRSVGVERSLIGNRVTLHLEPRLPLVTWNGAGFDRDGFLFAITPGTWSALPQASFLATARKADLGRWLGRLAAVPQVWSQVTAIKQDPSETMELTLKTGTVVIWGPPEPDTLVRKAQTLVRVIDDAHKNMGGTARADLRFFDQGRIIVRPKGVRPNS